MASDGTLKNPDGVEGQEMASDGTQMALRRQSVASDGSWEAPAGTQMVTRAEKWCLMAPGRAQMALEAKKWHLVEPRWHLEEPRWH